MACPDCGGEAAKVIYAGLPMRLCACSRLSGFWAFVVEWLPMVTDDGAFAFARYKGSYWRALWYWLRHP